MVALQIRDVPDEVRAVLNDAAGRRGVSMQAFLLELLVREARLERNRRLVAGYRPVRPSAGPEESGPEATRSLDSAELVRAGRAAREQQLLELLGDA